MTTMTPSRVWRCSCGALLDYVYHVIWRCRGCNATCAVDPMPPLGITVLVGTARFTKDQIDFYKDDRPRVLAQ